MAHPQEHPGRLTRALTRFTTGPDGSLRGTKLLLIAFAAGLVVAIGTTVALVAADAGSPGTLTVWVIVAFLGVKLPLLGLLWWLLGRAPRDTDPTPLELRAMLRRLDGAAATALRTPDAADRLAILSDEARFVLDRADPELRPEAARVASRLEALRQETTPV